MSDFLSNFGEENYKKLQKEKMQAAPREEPKQEPKARESAPARPRPAVEKAPVAATLDLELPDNAREELYILDPESESRRKKRRLLAALLLVVICAAAGVFYYQSKIVQLPDFIGDYADKAEVWALQNNIFVKTEEAHSVQYDRGIVMAQEPGMAEKIRKGSTMTITVSLGPDPDEHIPLPDFTAMTLPEIEEWKAANKADNVVITRVYDDTVPANQVIKTEFRDSSVTAETYRRRDRLTITVSRGPEEFEKDIEVPNFREKPEQEAVQWANSSGVELTVEYDYSDTVPAGYISYQSIPPKTLIAKNEPLAITVSKGRAVYAPDFSGLTKDEALAAAAAAGVSLFTIEQYHNTVEIGRFIEQSVPPGTLLKDGRNTVVVYYSAGLPYIPDLSGRQESEAKQIFASLNDKKAGLEYEIEYVYDAKTPKGTILFNSPANTTVPVGSTVKVTVSKGSKVIVGNYVNKNIQSQPIAKELQQLQAEGLKISYRYVDSTYEDETVPADTPLHELPYPSYLWESGTIISQSIPPGTEVDAADHILVLEIAR